MSETSPTPWKLAHSQAIPGAIISDYRGHRIRVAEMCGSMSNPDIAADAALIVQAVNCHAEMVEALKGIDRMLTQAYGDIGDNAVAERVGELAAAPWRTVRSALARAIQTNTGE